MVIYIEYVVIGLKLYKVKDSLVNKHVKEFVSRYPLKGKDYIEFQKRWQGIFKKEGKFIGEVGLNMYRDEDKPSGGYIDNRGLRYPFRERF